MFGKRIKAFMAALVLALALSLASPTFGADSAALAAECDSTTSGCVIDGG